MREIDGIQKVVAHLKPHWKEIDAHFESENGKLKAFLAQPHDLIGRVLKCHLILEHYLERFLSEHYGIDGIAHAKLGFFNKASLIPTKGSSATFVRPGILQLNKLRNLIGHNLAAEFSWKDLGAIMEILKIARPKARFAAPIDAIEAFTTVACTWLILPPKNLQSVFQEAFAKVRVRQSRES